MWLKNFFKELKAWHIVRKEYRKNKWLFDKFGIKKDWGGRLYKVINRAPEIELGSGEDEVYLRKELSEISAVLIKCNIYDILAYDLKPLDSVTVKEDGTEEFENGYLVVLTPAWNLDKQYVTFWSILFVILLFAGIGVGLYYGIQYLIPILQNLR
jgi:hypothetical protein